MKGLTGGSAESDGSGHILHSDRIRQPWGPCGSLGGLRGSQCLEVGAVGRSQRACGPQERYGLRSNLIYNGVLSLGHYGSLCLPCRAAPPGGPISAHRVLEGPSPTGPQERFEVLVGSGGPLTSPDKAWAKGPRTLLVECCPFDFNSVTGSLYMAHGDIYTCIYVRMEFS